MENPNRSLLQMNFEFSTNSKIRQKLLSLALMRDKSALTSRSSRRDSSYRSASQDKLTTQSPQPGLSNKRLKNFISLLYKSLTHNKIFTNELQKAFKAVQFDSCFENRQKVLQLEQELKCLKSGQSFTPCVSTIIEELVVLFNIVSAGQVKSIKKSEDKERKIEEILNWFSIGRMKTMPVNKEDADLFRAVLVVAGKECDKRDVVDVFRGWCSNPGVGVKMIRGIMGLLKRGLVDKDVVEKAYLFYQSSTKYTDNESIDKLVFLIEELALMFSIYPKVNKGLEKRLRKKATPVKKPSSPLPIAPKENKEKVVSTPKSSNDLTVKQASKASLLRNFYMKSRKDKLNADGYMSDNTDFSETESNRKPKNRKIEKMLMESRHFKRIEKNIFEFFDRKIAEGVGDMNEFENCEDYYLRKLEFVRGNAGEWSSECMQVVFSSEFGGDAPDPLQSLTKLAVVNRINEIIEKIQVDGCFDGLLG